MLYPVLCYVCAVLVHKPIQCCGLIDEFCCSDLFSLWWRWLNSRRYIKHLQQWPKAELLHPAEPGLGTEEFLKKCKTYCSVCVLIMFCLTV